jgi:hypothetical protein
MSNNKASDKQPPGSSHTPNAPDSPPVYTRPEPTSMPPDLATMKKGLDPAKKDGGL